MLFYLTPRFDNLFKRDAVDLRLSTFPCRVRVQEASRSSGRSTVRLLRDFDAKVFLAAHSAELIAEDDRLRELDTETKKQWELMGWGPTALTHR